MSSMCLNWEHMKSSLSLETKGRSAYHRHCLRFYPIILKPLKNVVESDGCWNQTLLTASSPTLPRVFGYLCWYLATVTMQNCFDGTKKETKKHGDCVIFPTDAHQPRPSKMQRLIQMAVPPSQETPPRRGTHDRRHHHPPQPQQPVPHSTPVEQGKAGGVPCATWSRRKLPFKISLSLGLQHIGLTVYLLLDPESCPDLRGLLLP